MTKPSVFISHVTSDRDVAVAIANGLEAYGIVAWTDDSLKSGDAFADMIERGLRDSDALVFLVSPASAASNWFAFEAGAAWARQQEDEHVRILPVLLRGAEFAALPPTLKRMHALDARELSIDTLVRAVTEALKELRTPSSSAGGPLTHAVI